MGRSFLVLALFALLVLGCHATEGAPRAEPLGSSLVSSSELEADVPLSGPPASSRSEVIETMLRLRVDHCREAIASIRQAVNDRDGFIETSHERDEGCPAEIVVRIPSTQLEEFIGVLRSTGTVLDAQQQVTDMSAPRADLAARLQNERAHEARLLAMMSERAATLSDLLRVSEQLRVVRESIERMEAQTRTLETQTTYARLAIHVERVPGVATSERHALDLLGDAGIAGLTNAHRLLVGIARSAKKSKDTYAMQRQSAERPPRSYAHGPMRSPRCSMRPMPTYRK